MLKPNLLKWNKHIMMWGVGRRGGEGAAERDEIGEVEGGNTTAGSSKFGQVTDDRQFI